MATKLFVGNIPYSVNSDGLRDIFAKVGEVAEANVVTDRETGRSRGFGFVEMSSDAEAQAAIEMWNGKELDGRTITVNEARPFEPRPRGEGGFKRGGGFGGGRRDY